jgi:hypothetical protein
MACGGCQKRAEAIRAGMVAIANGDKTALQAATADFSAATRADVSRIKTAAVARLAANRGKR